MNYFAFSKILSNARIQTGRVKEECGTQLMIMENLKNFIGTRCRAHMASFSC